jgi:drug/metabolite transporter (DMT)-like permease
MPVSELFAIAAATCSALSGMLIGELRGRVDIFRLGRWQMVAALVMTGSISLLVGGWRTVAPWQFGFLAASSFFGIVVASTTYYAAIYAIGARSTALLFSLTSPFALLLGYVALGETISLRQGVGVAFVLFGIALAIGLPRSRSADSEANVPSTGTASKAPWAGVALGVTTALGQALGSLCARPAMAAGVEPFTAMAMRSGVAVIIFFALAALPIPAMRRPYRFSSRALAIAVASAFFGAGLGMSLLMAALSRGKVGIVSTLSSATPVVILPMVWIRTGVAPPRSAWVGALMALAGAAFIGL